VFTLQGLIDVGHGLQRLVVGTDETLKILIAVFEIQSEGFDFFRGVRRLFGKQPPPKFFE
jgi:hypothetical protein